MSYNGSGTFVINSSGQPVVTGTVISSTAFNALTADLATGLSTAITKDGQTTTTARVPFAQGISSTLVTDATSATTGSIITAGGISTQKALWVGTTTTLAGALTYGGVTLSNAVTGTGNMVLSASPTLTGTLTAAGANFSGTITAASGAWSSAGIYSVASVTVGEASNAAYAPLSVYGAAAGDRLFIDNLAASGTNGSIAFGASATPNVGARILSQDDGQYGTNLLFQARHGSAGTTTTTNVTFLSTGQVGIGMTPSNVLDITQNTSSLAVGKILNSNAGTGSGSGWHLANGTANARYGLLGHSYTDSGVFVHDRSYIYNDVAGCSIAVAGPIAFSTDAYTEIARFGTDQSFLVGTTTNGGWTGVAKMEVVSGASTETISARITGAGGNAIIARVDSTSSNLMQFYSSTSSVGSITTNGTTTSYNVTSDYRLKENVQPMTGGLATVAALKPVTYDWIINGSAGEGFIAHELQAVVPAAVAGEKDAVDDKGEIKSQGVDLSKIVPHLVAAIQELTARLTALENK